ncbi:hypothetical protein ABMC89_07595 [Sulfitobacter sp. HNIBRBA3233]|uniref:hypothetical protein n=1 Tax=Sulfitobacter marinivivus TaxID=3158558 RepID=UPI0032DE35E5
MSFAQTYREERLISRRSRARKAWIAGRIIGFGLALCFVALLRLDPAFRSAVEEVAISAVSAATGREPPQRDVEMAEAETHAPQALEQIGIGETVQSAPPANALPQSRVKVNRGTGG